MTTTPELNLGYSIAFMVGVVWLVGWEVLGVISKRRGDTITEHWRWTAKKLPGPGSWGFRIFTGGMLVWTILHFLAGAD